VGEGEQEVDDGGREQSTAPAAGRQKAEQRAEAQGGRRGKNEAEDHFANPKKNRDFTVKIL
jgi:hypothetical protein